jgi:hypothetical protein
MRKTKNQTWSRCCGRGRIHDPSAGQSLPRLGYLLGTLSPPRIARCARPACRPPGATVQQFCNSHSDRIAGPSSVAAEPIRKPVRSLLEMRQERVIVQKWETSCAAAALATVLTFSRNDPITLQAPIVPTIFYGSPRFVLVPGLNGRFRAHSPRPAGQLSFGANGCGYVGWTN